MSLVTEHDGLKYAIYFKHRRYTDPDLIKALKRHGHTKCVIALRKPDMDVILAEGVAEAGLEDPYVKDAGRRIALDKAIVFIADQTLRGKLLQCYYGRPHTRCAVAEQIFRNYKRSKAINRDVRRLEAGLMGRPTIDAAALFDPTR